MAKRAKKKATKKVVKKAPLRKLPPKKVTKPIVVAKVAEPEKPKPIKDTKHLKVSINASRERYIEMGERVKAGELKWVYYAIDGEVGYHYYLIL